MYEMSSGISILSGLLNFPGSRIFLNTRSCSASWWGHKKIFAEFSRFKDFFLIFFFLIHVFVYIYACVNNIFRLL